MCCIYEAKTLRINIEKFCQEPEELPDLTQIRNDHAGEICPVCQGDGILRCRFCKNGEVSFLGGLQPCNRCAGGLKTCPACSGHGHLEKNSKQPIKDASKPHVQVVAPC